MLTFESLEANRCYFRTNEKIVVGGPIQRRIYEKDKEELFIKATSMPDVFSYGCKQLEDDWNHKAGYVWSSRAGVINKEFGTRFIEVSINSRCYAMDVDTVKALVEAQTGEKYTIVEELRFDDKEPYYNLVKED